MQQQSRQYPLLIVEEDLPSLDRLTYEEYGKPLVDVDRIREQLQDIKRRLTGVFDDDDEKGLGLKTLEVSLAIGMEGGVWFISKGTVEGSIKLTFER